MYHRWDDFKFDPHLTPSRFSPLLSLSPIPETRWFYWWRAIAAAYLMRPNERTLGALQARRAEIFKATQPKPGTFIAVHVGSLWRYLGLCGVCWLHVPDTKWWCNAIGCVIDGCRQ